MKILNKFNLIALIFISLNSHAQNLVCFSNGYQNIVRSGNNTNNTHNILILNITDATIYAEANNPIDNKMFRNTYKIVSRSKETVSAYEVPMFEGMFAISSISISLQENIATRVTVNPNGASVILFKCNTK
jgi:hypothetical protein